MGRPHRSRPRRSAPSSAAGLRAALPAALAFAAIGLSGAAGAGERRLEGPTIERMLAGVEVVFDEARQRFYPDGSTEYITDRVRAGRWAVRFDVYCSLWPPSDLWSCFDVYERRDAEGRWLIWVAPDGDRSEGRVAQGTLQ